MPRPAWAADVRQDYSPASLFALTLINRQSPCAPVSLLSMRLANEGKLGAGGDDSRAGREEGNYAAPRPRRSIPASWIPRTCAVTSRYRSSSSAPDSGSRSRRASGSTAAGSVEMAPPPLSV